MEKIRCKCIDKFRDKNNNIIGYSLQDEQSRCNEEENLNDTIARKKQRQI